VGERALANPYNRKIGRKGKGCDMNRDQTFRGKLVRFLLEAVAWVGVYLIFVYLIGKVPETQGIVDQNQDRWQLAAIYTLAVLGLRYLAKVSNWGRW
jgi:hypothetical protein